MRKHEKFMFNMHNFDEPEVLEEEIVSNEPPPPPPPPTFTEAELEKAKQRAFNEGKQAGMSEALESIEKQTAMTLEQTKLLLPDLLAQEDAREIMFEQETLRMVETALAALFPVYAKNHGLGELKKIIAEALQTVHGMNAITLSVHPDVQKTIQSHITALIAQGGVNVATSIEVLGDETIAQSNCVMAWKNGGMSYDLDDLITQVTRTVSSKIEDQSEGILSPPPPPIGASAAEEDSPDTQIEEPVLADKTDDKIDSSLAQEADNTHDKDLTNEDSHE